MSLGRPLKKEQAADFVKLKKNTFSSYITSSIYIKHDYKNGRAIYHENCLKTVCLFLDKGVIRVVRDPTGKEYTKQTLGPEIRKLCGTSDGILIRRLLAGEAPKDIAEDMYIKLPKAEEPAR